MSEPSKAAKRLAEEFMRGPVSSPNRPDYLTWKHAFDWLLAEIRKDRRGPDYKFIALFLPGGKYGPDPEPPRPAAMTDEDLVYEIMRVTGNWPGEMPDRRWFSANEMLAVARSIWAKSISRIEDE